MMLYNASSQVTDDTADAPPEDPMYRKAQALAYKALLLTDTYRVPPVPRAYEVWYSYAKGVPEALARQINELIERKGSIDVYDVDQIHLEHLSVSENERKRQELLGDHLDHEMDEILKLVQSHLESSEDYAGSLKQTAAALSPTATPQQIRSAVEALLAENSRMRSESDKLRESLQQAREQVKELRTSLNESRENEMRDSMTGLANRRLFELRLAREIAGARKTGAPLFLVIADIDHFKHFNDTFGHQVGDDVLRYFARILTKHVNGSDLAARYGGEEFALIMAGKDLVAVQATVRRIMADLEATRLVMSKGKNPIGELTASFGIAQLKPEDDAKRLFVRADKRLYEAKRGGRNRIASL